LSGLTVSLKALTLSYPDITRQALLAHADAIAGAWIGIRIAALLLWRAGWKSTAIAELFGVSRWAVCHWMGLANAHGLRSIQPQPAPGRKPRLSPAVQKQLELALQAPPEQFGLDRTRWDGLLVVEFLRRFHQVELQVRQAQRYGRRLGFTLQMPSYRYLQATHKGVEKFQRAVKNKLRKALRFGHQRVVLSQDESG